MDFERFTSKFGKEITLNQVNYLPAAPLLQTKLHSHFNMLHITCVKKGYGTCWVKGEAWKLGPGSVHFVVPGEIHRYIADAKNPYHIFFMHLSWYGEIPEELPRQLIIPSRKRRTFYQRLRQLSELLMGKTDNCAFRKYGLFALFMADVFQFSKETNANPITGYISANSQNENLNYVFKQLYGPPFEFPGINKLAENCNMSRRKFTDHFKKITGMTVKQYYLRNVMTYASTMIQSGEFKITDIASQCGFSNPQNFLYAYKQYRNSALLCHPIHPH